jgi:hypothetical protein
VRSAGRFLFRVSKARHGQCGQRASSTAVFGFFVSSLDHGFAERQAKLFEDFTQPDSLIAAATVARAQRALISRLERDGRYDEITVAKELLAQLEETRRLHLWDKERLQRALWELSDSKTTGEYGRPQGARTPPPGPCLSALRLRRG